MHLGIAYAVVTTKKPIANPVYEITTRGNLDKFGYLALDVCI
jgi:hypothetical protein